MWREEEGFSGDKEEKNCGFVERIDDSILGIFLKEGTSLIENCLLGVKTKPTSRELVGLSDA